MVNPLLIGLGGAISGLAGTAFGSFLSGGGGGTFGSFNVASPQTLVTKKTQNINSPFTFTQISPTTVTETTIISDSPNASVTSKKDFGGVSAQPIQSLVPLQLDQFGGGGGGEKNIFDEVKPLILLGGLGYVGYLVFKK